MTHEPCTHNGPWCVGSVFFPPQLLTSNLGPLVFNPLGNPQCLLSTNQRLQQFETGLSKSKQTESFVDTPFIPRGLLQDHLLSDSSSNQYSQVYGNLLQSLKCNDGSFAVFLISGEDNNRIASSICRQGSNGRWYPMRTFLSSQCLSDAEEMDWSFLPSFPHSIQQLSAAWADSCRTAGSGLAIVAARANYHLYFCTILIEDDQVQFISSAVAKFQAPTAHVTWSPHVNGRVAVILESGTLCLFEITASRETDPSGVREVIPTLTLRCPIQRHAGQSTALVQSQDREHGPNEPKSASDLQVVGEGAPQSVSGLERKWWSCEFGWLPHTMVIANSQEIFIMDFLEQSSHDSAFYSLRMTESSKRSSTSGLASTGASQHSRFCFVKSGKENIVALGRDSNVEMYEFSVATERHVILFDTRQPQTPILQWEHGMRQDAPSLLIMCPLSALRCIDDREKNKANPNGRVILAVSFKSGDIRVFCYGSGVPAAEMPVGKDRNPQKVEDHDWGSATYAWDIPSRLYAPVADVDDWREVLRSAQGFYGDGLLVPKSRKRGSSTAGIVLLSNTFPECAGNEREKKTFTILQLTGEGEVLTQIYKASHELQEPLKATILSIDNNSDVEESHDARRPQYHELKFEVLPAFLKYIHTGSVLKPRSSKGYQKEHDDAEWTLYSGQKKIIGGPTLDRTSRDHPNLNPYLEKTRSKAGIETQLKALVEGLNVPLTMSEVARKVLGMGLPEGFAPLDAGIPSDLSAYWNRGYEFPSISPLLGCTLPSATSGDLRGDGDRSQDTFSNGLIRKSSFQESIPLPLLLEVHNINTPEAVPSSENGGSSQANHLIQNEHLTDTKLFGGSKFQKYNDVPFVDAHKLLLEGGHYVEGLIKQLVSENEPAVVSLGEDTQEWNEIPDIDGRAGSQIFLYRVPEREGDHSTSGRVHSEPEPLIAGDKVFDRMHMATPSEGAVLHDEKERSRNSLQDVCCKVVAGKGGFENQESHPGKQYLKLDPNLCPVKLCFTDPDEELEPGELTALDDMQASFLQWQQSFSPYRTLL